MLSSDNNGSADSGARLEAALAYAAEGLPVLPLKPNRKEPLTEHGCLDATTDSAQIRAWWECWPDANIGIATGKGLHVIDIDGPEGAETLAELCIEHGPIPATRGSRTGREGGRHLYFATNENLRSIKLGPGLDTRGEGGYVVAPPSIHPTGAVYTSNGEPIAAMPAWLAGLLPENKREPAQPVGDEIPKGERDATFTSLAGTMRRRGLSEAAILAALRETNTERCRPPLAEAQLAKIARSVSRYEPEAVSLNGSAPARSAADLADVDGVLLLGDIREFISRHMVLPSPESADLLALWTLHTWAFEAAWATGYLRITSAAPECGKTQLMEILAALTRKGWHAVNPSPAVLYRRIDRDRPTLLLDELDNFPMADRLDALAVLNAGYKSGATVDRCSERGELQSFDCFCPKAYAGIDTKQLAPSLLSRSITIRLDRKTAAEHVEMWIAKLAEPETEALCERCEAWAQHHVEALRGAQPDLPGGFVNRTVEAWWALLAIADEVGDEWPERARRAAVVLSAGGDTRDEQSEGVALLAGIREAFGAESVISTSALLALLNADTEAPWGARRRGEGLDPRGLSRLLRPHGIKPRSVRIGADTPKGYRFDQFADAFARYLEPPENPPHPTQAPHSSAGAMRDVSDVSDVAANPGAGGAPSDPQADLFSAPSMYGDGAPS